MDSKNIVDCLLAGNVLKDTGDELRITETFRQQVEQLTGDVRERGLNPGTESLERLASWWPEALETGFGDHPELQAQFLALADALPELSGDDLIRVLFVLDTVKHPPDRTDGSPDAFFPVRGDRFAIFCSFIDHGVAYVWRGDCDPCEVIVEEFGDLPQEIVDEELLVSIYGPGSPEVLYEQFDISGAPTTLFLANGDVDSRLVGAHPVSVIETEIRTARQQADTDVGAQD
jgi:hypothetical protein